MSADPMDAMNRRIEAWLGQGSDDHPPAGLLDLSLARTRSVPQRSALHAALGRVPRIGPVLPRRRQTAWVLIAAAILIAAGIAVVGSGVIRPDPLRVIVPSVVPPTNTAEPSRTPAVAIATQTPRPSATVLPSAMGFTGPGFLLTYAPGWRQVTGSALGGTYAFSNGPVSQLGNSYVFSVSLAGGGDPIVVKLGQQAGSVQISGRSLDELAASVEKEIAGSAPTRTAVTIGGELGYRYSPPEASYVGPLASIAITYRDGTAWVFMENIIFDAPPSGAFGTFLSSFSFR